MPTWRLALFFAAALFGLYVLARVGLFRWAARGFGRKPPGPAPFEAELRAARASARDAKSPRERAEALLHAAEAAKADPALVAAYLGRAMKADPTWPDPVRLAVRLLVRRRPRLLEKMLLRHLAALLASGGLSGPHAASARAAAQGLRRVQAHRDPTQGAFFAELARSLR